MILSESSWHNGDIFSVTSRLPPKHISVTLAFVLSPQSLPQVVADNPCYAMNSNTSFLISIILHIALSQEYYIGVVDFIKLFININRQSALGVVIRRRSFRSATSVYTFVYYPWYLQRITKSNGKSNNRFLPGYSPSLQNESKKQYEQKLDVIGGIDP